MTYNDVLKKLESIGIEIDYTKIHVDDLFKDCEDPEAFQNEIVTDLD